MLARAVWAHARAVPSFSSKGFRLGVTCSPLHPRPRPSWGNQLARSSSAKNATPYHPGCDNDCGVKGNHGIGQTRKGLSPAHTPGRCLCAVYNLHTRLSVSCLAWRAIPSPLSKLKRRLDTLESTQCGNPLQRSCLENPRDGGACWAAVYGIAQSRTRLKRLSNHNRSQ